MNRLPQFHNSNQMNPEHPILNSLALTCLILVSTFLPGFATAMDRPPALAFSHSLPHSISPPFHHSITPSFPSLIWFSKKMRGGPSSTIWRNLSSWFSIMPTGE